MAYMHIENLYRDQSLLMFKEVYALEKVHGSSAHISWKPKPQYAGEPELRDKAEASGEHAYQIHFFAGATKHVTFLKLFNEEDLYKKFLQLGHPRVTIFGEAYGGSLHHMSATYGKERRFVAFDIQIGDSWLNVPNAADVAAHLGLDFVDFKLVPTTIEALDAERNADSVQAIKCGMGPGHKREGLVLHPPIELTKNNGERLICKYKRKDFEETATPREVTPEELQVLADANAIALEWVTEMRISHVLDKFPDATIASMGSIIRATLEDVLRESSGEIVVSREATRAICTRAGKLLKERFLREKE